MFLTFFNDFLSQQKGLSVPVATMVRLVVLWPRPRRDPGSTHLPQKVPMCVSSDVTVIAFSHIQEGRPVCRCWSPPASKHSGSRRDLGRSRLRQPRHLQVTMVWGLGGGVGVIGGGYMGQWIYNRAPPRMPLAAGAVTAASVFPMWCVFSSGCNGGYKTVPIAPCQQLALSSCASHRLRELAKVAS